MMRLARRYKGFSLLEASIVLAIVGTVTAAVWQVMASTKQASMSGTLFQQVQLTTRSVREYFSGRAMPTSAADMNTNYTLTKMREAGVFPEDMCPANCVSGAITTVRNIYGGVSSFALPKDIASKTGAPLGNRFQLTFQSVPKRGCAELVMKLSSRSNEFGLTGVTIGANSEITTFPISLTTLDTQCAATNNTIVLVMKIRS